MKFLGLDTGFAAMGYAVLDDDLPGITQVGVIPQGSMDELDHHARVIIKELSQLLKEVDVVVMESPYYSVNPLVMGQTWRVIGRLETWFQQMGLHTMVVTPAQVKSAAGKKKSHQQKDKDWMREQAWERFRYPVSGTKAYQEACADAMWVAEAGRILFEREAA